MAKVLIVEDDAAIAQMYRQKLETAGYSVQIAANGNLGLEAFENFAPDLILLDLMMPEMNGDEMLEKLRKTPGGKNTKVIIMTNVSNQEAPDSLAHLGVSSYIVKADVTPSQVADLIRQHVKA